MPSSEYLLGHSLEAFDDQGNLKDADKVAQLDGLFKDFQTFVTVSGHLNNAKDLNQKDTENFDWNKL